MGAKKRKKSQKSYRRDTKDERDSGERWKKYGRKRVRSVNVYPLRSEGSTRQSGLE